MTPSSNSWLPTLETSRCIALSDSTDGSSWNRPENERRPADQVAGGDGQAVPVALAQLGELGGEVLRTTGRLAADRAGRVGLEVAVVVVEGEELQFDELPLRVGVSWRMGIAVAAGRRRTALNAATPSEIATALAAAMIRRPFWLRSGTDVVADINFLDSVVAGRRPACRGNNCCSTSPAHCCTEAC